MKTKASVSTILFFYAELFLRKLIYANANEQFRHGNGYFQKSNEQFRHGNGHFQNQISSSVTEMVVFKIK